MPAFVLAILAVLIVLVHVDLSKGLAAFPDKKSMPKKDTYVCDFPEGRTSHVWDCWTLGRL